MQRKYGKKTGLWGDHSRILTGGGEWGQTFSQWSDGASPKVGLCDVSWLVVAGRGRPALHRLKSTTSLGIFVPQLCLPAGHRDRASLNEDLFHVGLDVQRIAVRHHDICGFADIERAELVGDSPDFRGIEGDCLERFVVGDAEGDGESSLVG